MRNIKLLLWAGLLLTSCKKELNGDFDRIIGKWKWVKSIHGWEDNHGFPYFETVAPSATSQDSYSISFEKKGKIITYKNGKVEDKFRVKDYQTAYIPVGDTWGYSIKVNGKKIIDVTYYVSKDTLEINDFFPRTLSDYNLSSSSSDFINNYFIRE